MISESHYFSPDLLKNHRVLDVGYTEDPLATSFSQFKKWVANGKNANLKYLEGDRMQIREDLRHYFPEFKSAFVFLFDYSAVKIDLEKFYQSKESNGFKIASYTMYEGGEDYHFSIRKKLEEFSLELKKSNPLLKTLFSLDTQPILERDLAYRSGLGWFGKNSMLINRFHGSFFLIGAILTDQTFSFPIKKIDSDHCGSCLACVEACPTSAIDLETRTVDSSLCVPNFTIEHFKDSGSPPSGYEQMNEIFGCDICQDVCPWNKKVLGDLEGDADIKESGILNFFLKKDSNLIKGELSEMSKKGFKRKFKNTSFERTGRDGLLKNLKYKK